MKLDNLYDKVYNWVVNTGPLIIIGIITLLFGLWLIKVIKKRVGCFLADKYSYKSPVNIAFNLCILLLYGLLIIGVASIVGFQFSIFTSTLGAFAVAAGLTLSGALQNIASYLLLIIFRPFEIGDVIVVQGQTGWVSSIQLFFTTLSTTEGKKAVIPNVKLFSEIILNLTGENVRQLNIELKLSYATDVVKVKTLILDAITATETILTDSRTVVGISEFEADGVRFMVHVWVNHSDYLLAKSALQEKIMMILISAGIKMPGT